MGAFRKAYNEVGDHNTGKGVFLLQNLIPLVVTALQLGATAHY